MKREKVMVLSTAILISASFFILSIHGTYQAIIKNDMMLLGYLVFLLPGIVFILFGIDFVKGTCEE